MNQPQAAVSQRAATIVVTVLAIFAVLCFAFAGASILENATTTAKVFRHAAPSLG
jgi:hypothetical protein